MHLQVKIMKEWDPSGKQGPKMPLPDIVKIHEPKNDEESGFYDDKVGSRLCLLTGPNQIYVAAHSRLKGKQERKEDKFG